MSKYSSEFKLKVVKYYLEEHHGFIETAKHFKIASKGSVKSWVKKYEKHGTKGLMKNFKAFIMLKNYGSSNNHFEKVMIFINMNHSSDDIKMEVICGKKDNIYVPVLKKVCIVKQTLNENEKDDIIKQLEITEKEIEQIKKDGYWYPDISNEVGY